MQILVLHGFIIRLCEFFGDEDFGPFLAEYVHVQLVEFAVMPRLHEFLQIGILPLGVVAVLDVALEHLRHPLPEVGIDLSQILPDDVIRGHPHFAVYEFYHHQPLAESQPPEYGVKIFQKVIFHVAQIPGLLLLAESGRLEQTVGFVDGLGHEQGVGVGLAEIVDPPVILHPIPLVEVFLGMDAGCLDFIDIERVPLVGNDVLEQILLLAAVVNRLVATVAALT